MRVYGRTTDEYRNITWQVVETDSNGFNDAVYVTALAQCLSLNLNESPFYAQFGIPAQPSVITQIFPDFYVNYIQSQYAQYFTSLKILKVPIQYPYYDIYAVTHIGSTIQAQVPI
jgi:hypothetical protein